MKRLLAGAFGTAGLLFGAGSVLGCAFSAPGHRGEPNGTFDGERFHNLTPVAPHGFGEMARWALTRKPGPWTEVTDATPAAPPPERVDDLRVTWVGHATLLVQIDGVNVLTDPHWGERASPVSWAGPKRMHPPGIRFEDLPPIDVVLVSHNHYDHLDLDTVKRLAAEHDPEFVVGLGNERLLAEVGVTRVTPLDWWGRTETHGLVVHAVPVQHFSARGITDRNATLWTGFVVEGAAGPVYFAGDTGFGPHFEAVRERFGPMRLALLPIGAFRPRDIMARVHISPREALLAHHLLDARTSVAMHFDTFPLADDGQGEAAALLRRGLEAGEAEGSRPRFWILAHGEGRDVPPLHAAARGAGAAGGGAAGPAAPAEDIE